MDYDTIKNYVQSKGYVFFDRGRFNLNLIGQRTPSDGSNTFNDIMYVVYKDSFDDKKCLSFPITTDPGTHYRINPINPKGTGIIAGGQWRGCWKIGLHKGYPALVQVKPMGVYRDNNKDNVLDKTNIEMDLNAFNCHRASKKGTSINVDKWSAGCQTYANCFDHDILMALCYRSAAIHGDSFSYTLLE